MAGAIACAFIYKNQVESRAAVVKDLKPLKRVRGELMKIRIMLVMLCVLAISPVVFSQNSVKLFDPVLTTVSQLGNTGTFADAVEFDTKQVYLSCPVSGGAVTLSGPGGTDFLVDNFIRIDTPGGGTSDVCPNYQVYGCFDPIGIDTLAHIGEPVTNSLDAIAPLDISSVLSAGPGIYNFKLMDYSVSYGSTEVWLNTSCRIVGQVCHRNNGSSGQKTLNVGAAAVPAHLAHGDTLGPCTQ